MKWEDQRWRDPHFLTKNTIDSFLVFEGNREWHNKVLEGLGEEEFALLSSEKNSLSSKNRSRAKYFSVPLVTDSLISLCYPFEWAYKTKIHYSNPILINDLLFKKNKK